MDFPTSSSSSAVTCAPFDNILNFRDVGKTVNRFAGKRLVAEGILFRSARPDDGTLSDRKRLCDGYGIKTVMDLRTKSEHMKQAKKRQADLAVPSILLSNDALAEPMKIPGLDYLEININGKGFERSLVKKLSIWSFIKLVVLMIFGYRMEAIAILGREVMQPRGLIGLGCDTVDYCGSEIAHALRAFCSQSRYPVLVHCTQGKDRTGLIIALLLLLLEVPLEAVTYDYCLSENELLPERESRLAEMREMGFSEDFALTPKDWMPQLVDHLDVKYGGLKGYLHSIGLEEDSQLKLGEILSG